VQNQENEITAFWAMCKSAVKYNYLVCWCYPCKRQTAKTASVCTVYQ